MNAGATSSSYSGSIHDGTCTTMTFDLPAAYTGKQCAFYFLLPHPGTMETSNYTMTAGMSARLSVHGEPTWSAPLAPGHPVRSDMGACAGGATVQSKMCGEGGALEWFQDYNPCPVGAYILAY